MPPERKEKEVVYSEHDKLREVQTKTQAIHDFLDWLSHQYGYQLGKPHEHDGSFDEGGQCFRKHVHKEDICHIISGECHREWERDCPASVQEFIPMRERLDKVLAQYFEIDLDKLEDEKRAMLDSLRKSQEGK